MPNAVMDTRRLARWDFRGQFQYRSGDETDFNIAVTGHRPNRLPPRARRAVGEDIGALLKEIQAQSDLHARRPVLISALAEGADRMASEAARERGVTFRAVLPFAAAEYAKDFSDAASQAQFQTLMAAAERVEVLPGNAQNRDSAYEAAGLAMLEGADILIAVWDGGPSAGRGGTAEIIGFAMGRGLPVLVVDAQAEKPPRAFEREDSVSNLVAHAMRAKV